MNMLHKCVVVLTTALISLSAQAQNKSCCSATAFASLGSDPSFIATHTSPEPFHFVASKGSMITFDTPGGGKANAFLVPAAEKSNKFLFVFHEWWGLNDYIKEVAEKFSLDFPNVNILAIDLYDGKIATDPDQASKMMQAIAPAHCEAIVKGALAYVGKDAMIQTIGWCFGGGWSLQASILAGSMSKGCVIYYGPPENDQKKLKLLSAPVLGIYGAEDDWINKKVVDEFASSMKAAGKSFEPHWYDGVHAFANPSNPKHDSAAAADANRHAVAFIHKNFGE